MHTAQTRLSTSLKTNLYGGPDAAARAQEPGGQRAAQRGRVCGAQDGHHRADARERDRGGGRAAGRGGQAGTAGRPQAAGRGGRGAARQAAAGDQGERKRASKGSAPDARCRCWWTASRSSAACRKTRARAPRRRASSRRARWTAAACPCPRRRPRRSACWLPAAPPAASSRTRRFRARRRPLRATTRACSRTCITGSDSRSARRGPVSLWEAPARGTSSRARCGFFVSVQLCSLMRSRSGTAGFWARWPCARRGRMTCCTPSLSRRIPKSACFKFASSSTRPGAW